MWLSLGVVEVALSAAALEGGISTINWVKPFHSPSRDESDPNHLWSGGEMGLSPPPTRDTGGGGGGGEVTLWAA